MPEEEQQLRAVLGAAGSRAATGAGQRSRDRALVALLAHNGCASARPTPAELSPRPWRDGFEAVPLASVTTVVLGLEVSRAEAGGTPAGLG